ncbi:MAG: DUF4149 domain-containing protein [Gallionella sp.]|nr:DUF4149 domain-containing protein [Gallionella sp.]
MKNIPHHIATLLTTAWVGGLWATGYLAAPVLFFAQPDKQLAGMLAGHMFTWMSYVGMVCGAYLLLHRVTMFDRTPTQKQIVWIIASMLLITLILQCGIQPMMAALKVQALPLDVIQSALADRFKAMHGISQILYLIQSLLGAALVVKSRL